MMRRWLLTGVLTMWAALASAQLGDVSAADDPIDAFPPALSIALPNQWLILQPRPKFESDCVYSGQCPCP